MSINNETHETKGHLRRLACVFSLAFIPVFVGPALAGSKNGDSSVTGRDGDTTATSRVLGRGCHSSGDHKVIEGIADGDSFNSWVSVIKWFGTDCVVS